ncbi:DUF262 domain-containing protein [Haloplanus rubicundus]|uniref:DUF262 domain-containing protein n=1 Tax=Haloplanus rubicundus TaxID=1547898 RepID=A0A345E2Z2_9EURY|nr:DUF262 domain-containing protein [Haloplanus rubicundus]AXG06564.1 DUF262 domain-containing protein [Haloplanus rubicundus]
MGDISDYIQDINRRIFLPGLQREFVWSEKQTENLFDSLIREYPIGLITRWDVAHTDAEYYPYEFIQNYVDDSRAVPDTLNDEGYRKYNEEADEESSDLSYLVIDGQQRLTSLFIGLCGQRIEYTKGKGGRRSNIEHWSSRELCVNLLGHPDFDGDDLAGDYEFEFRKTADYDDGSDFGFVRDSDGTERYWYPLPKMMNEQREVRSARDRRNETESELADADLSEERRSHLLEIRSEVLPKIESRILDAELPSKDVKKNSSEIKEIFQRINIEGEDPDPYQLLLSRMMSTWPFTPPEAKQINPRKKTEQWVQSFQDKFGGYETKIDRQLFMRYSMYLVDNVLKTRPISDLTDSDMEEIRKKWLQDRGQGSEHEADTCRWYCYCLDAAFTSVTKLGFNSTSMSTMAMIAALGKFYYLNPNADPEGENNLRQIYRFLSKLLLLKSSKGSLGRVEATRVSNFLSENRNEDYTEFPADEAFEYLKSFTDIEIGTETVKNIVKHAEYQNSTSSDVFSSWDVAAILNLSTPYAQFADADSLEVDHIYPQSKAEKIADELDLDEGNEINIHRVGNLQLLPGEKNRQKGSKEPANWLQDDLSDHERGEYKRVNNFPDAYYPLVDNYPDFVREREEMIIESITEEVQS